MAQVEVINEILKEVPDQFVDYMVLKKITPDYNYVNDEEENANILDINNILESQRSELTQQLQNNNYLLQNMNMSPDISPHITPPLRVS